ncbi:MAG: DNA-binding NarL/FixJ family response regulator, partial [Gammaproteobacteria bacterium]
EGLPISHVFLEAGVFLAITVALAFEIKQGVDLSHSVSVTQASIDRLKKQLHEVINDEFIRWKLSSSEKEIALFLIKGLSMKEIADLRSVKEKSVRQQSTGIYQKSGVANRNELVAYFIEDMLPLGAS